MVTSIPQIHGSNLVMSSYDNGYLQTEDLQWKSDKNNGFDFVQYRIYNKRYRDDEDSDQDPYDSISLLLFNEKIYIMMYPSYPSFESIDQFRDTSINTIISHETKWGGSVNDFYAICKENNDFEITNRKLDVSDVDYKMKHDMYKWYINWFENL